MSRYSKDYYKDHFREKLRAAITERFGAGRQGSRIFKDKYIELSGIAELTSNTFYSWYSRENSAPNLDNLIFICQVLSCDMDYFLTDQECLCAGDVQAADQTGLSVSAIETIKFWKREKEKGSSIHSRDTFSLDCLNSILEHYKRERDNLRQIPQTPRTSIFRKIWEYITADKMQRLSASRVYYSEDGGIPWHELHPGDGITSSTDGQTRKAACISFENEINAEHAADLMIFKNVDTGSIVYEDVPLIFEEVKKTDIFNEIDRIKSTIYPKAAHI